jgi:hypothetical protein
MDQRKDDKNAIDKADEKDAKMMLVEIGRKMMRMMYKHWEDAEEEGSRSADIKDATAMKTESQEGVQEDTVEVDKDETDEEYMMKQDEALLNRENAPEVRIKSQRITNSRHSKNWRLRELMMLLILLMLQVDVVMARDNLGQGQVE